MTHQSLLERIVESGREIILITMLWMKSMKRPIVIVFLLVEPIILGIIANRSLNINLSDTDGSLVVLVLFALMAVALSLPFQAGFSTVILVDVLGGETKQSVDLTLLSTTPINQNELVVADILLGSFIVQIQLFILDIVVILGIPITKNPLVIFQGIIILGLAFMVLTLLIVAITIMLIKTISAALAYFVAPITFISWKMIVFAIAENFESSWVSFVDPSTAIQMVIMWLLGPDGSTLYNRLYASSPSVMRSLVLASNFVLLIVLISIIITFVLCNLRGNLVRP